MTPHPSLTIEYILNIHKDYILLKIASNFMDKLPGHLSRLVGKLKIFSYNPTWVLPARLVDRTYARLDIHHIYMRGDDIRFSKIAARGRLD